MEAPQLLLDAVHSLALEVQATGRTPQVARESNAMRSLSGVRETERPLQTVEGWLASPVSTLLVSSHSGQMSGWYGFVYVKFPFCLWAGWDLVLSRGVFLAKVDKYHPCLLTAQLPYLLMVSVGREDPAVFGVGTPTLWCKLGMGTMPLASYLVIGDSLEHSVAMKCSCIYSLFFVCLRISHQSRSLVRACVKGGIS